MTRLCGVAKRRMFEVSIISTMKVDSPRARSSDAPTREKIRSTTPIAGAPGRNEAAGLRHQHEQGGLPQIGRLAAHVGSGEQDDLRALGIELEIVGDEVLAQRRPRAPDGGRLRSRGRCRQATAAAGHSRAAPRLRRKPPAHRPWRSPAPTAAGARRSRRCERRARRRDGCSITNRRSSACRIRSSSS